MVPLADPFFIVTGTSTPVTVTAYILDSNQIINGVNLARLDNNGEPIADLGILNDDGTNGDIAAGDSVFTITTDFNENEEGMIRLRISADLGTIQEKITSDFEISVVKTPTIQDYTQYNQIIDDILVILLATRNNFGFLIDELTSTEQFSEYMSQVTTDLLLVYIDLDAINQFETHSPSNFPKLLEYLPKFGSLVTKANKASEEMDLFITEGLDPRVKEIADWAITAGCLDESELSGTSYEEERKICANQYQKYNTNSSFHEALRESEKIIVREEVGQFTDLIGQGIGERYDLGPLVVKGINFGIRKLIYVFIIK